MLLRCANVYPPPRLPPQEVHRRLDLPTWGGDPRNVSDCCSCPSPCQASDWPSSFIAPQPPSLGVTSRRRIAFCTSRQKGRRSAARLRVHTSRLSLKNQRLCHACSPRLTWAFRTADCPQNKVSEHNIEQGPFFFFLQCPIASSTSGRAVTEEQPQQLGMSVHTMIILYIFLYLK